MRKPLTAIKQTDDYLRLVRIFPLRKIRTDGEHAEALKISGRLLGMKRKLTHGEAEYLDVLILLVQEFERARQTVPLPRAKGMSVLKHLMAEQGMTQKQLARMLGVGQPAVSMIFAGSRELTKSHIDKLSHHFGVGVSAFFG